MSAARAFGMVGVNRSARNRADGVLHEAGFVERVGVDGHLHVELVGDGQTSIDGRGRRAPIFVQLQAERAGTNLLDERGSIRPVALAEKSEVQRERLCRFVHAADVPGARRARRGLRAGGRPRAATDERGDAGMKRVGNLRRRDEMHVGVNGASRQDVPLAGNDFRGRADLEPGRHAVHDARIPGLAESGNAAIPDADIRLVDACGVEDNYRRDDEIRRSPLAAGGGRLSHAVANDLPAAELRLVAVHGRITLDLNDDLGVGEPDAVAGGRSIVRGVCATVQSHAGGWWLVDLLRPCLRRCGEGAHGVQRLLPRDVVVEWAVHETIQTDHFPAPPEGDEFHGAAVSGLEADGRACRNIQAHAVGRLALEDQIPVHLEEMAVRTDLHGTVSGVGDLQTTRGAARIELEVRVRQKVFARDHDVVTESGGVS